MRTLMIFGIDSFLSLLFLPLVVFRRITGNKKAGWYAVESFSSFNDTVPARDLKYVVGPSLFRYRLRGKINTNTTDDYLAVIWVYADVPHDRIAAEPWWYLFSLLSK